MGDNNNMPFTYSLEEDRKDRHKFIMITGFDGSVRDLVVPEIIDGERVEAIGNHSFSGRGDLETVTLPESIRTLYGFAFHNCRNLRKITLFDSIDDYYDGVCRQCDSLSDIEITVNRSWFEVIRNFLADSDRTLRFIINVLQDSKEPSKETVSFEHGAQYVTSALTFPEYVYDFSENTMARTIQFSIAGSGMFYRECVDRRSINYREYDRLFDKARIDGGRITQDIAIGRLLYPVELDEKSCISYENYIRGSGTDILTRLVTEAGTSSEALKTIKALLTYRSNFGEDGRNNLFEDVSIDAALKLASSKKNTEVCAILMDAQGPSGMGGQTSDIDAFVF